MREASGGRGADIIVETAGATLAKSLSAVAFGGTVSVVGFVAGSEATVQLRQLIGPMVRVQGIAVGSRARVALHDDVDAAWLAATGEARARDRIVAFGSFLTAARAIRLATTAVSLET